MTYLQAGINGRRFTVPNWLFLLWSTTAAFGTYFCIYGFRKPFTAAGYEGAELWGIEYKAVLVASQVFGYTLSKFVGIRVIAEMSPQRRTRRILLLVAVAQLALLAFGLTPPPYNLAWLFINGLPLGMAFGMVLRVLEGRVLTEMLTAGLCASFILADGFTKSVGGWLLKAGVSEGWMPFAAGALFLPPLAGFVAMLACVPPPDTRDVDARSVRTPMTANDRRRFFMRYAVGLSAVIALYLTVTILRSVRADFAREIWSGLGYVGSPSVFTLSEIVVSLGVVILTGAGVLIRDNRAAFFTAVLISIAGLLLIPLAVVGRSYGLDGFGFMVLIGLGLYLPYVAVHTTIFERLIAMTGDRGNIGFLMYLTDSIGYLGYVGVMLCHGMLAMTGVTVAKSGDFLAFFEPLCWVISGAGIASAAVCWVYFARRQATVEKQIALVVPAGETA
ncbi:MAG TPA: DUF5690 family protein [Pirellulales bacterium]|nr:DUF5690 family protein [Pirellulales bacterium]